MFHPDFHTLLLIAILIVAIGILRKLTMLQTALANLETNQLAEAKVAATTADSVTRVEKLVSRGADQATIDRINSAAKVSSDNAAFIGGLNDRLTVIAPIPATPGSNGGQ